MMISKQYYTGDITYITSFGVWVLDIRFITPQISLGCPGNVIYSPVLVHSLVPPQVGAFLPHVSSEAIPPAHQASSLLQPVCGSQVCVCV